MIDKLIAGLMRMRNGFLQSNTVSKIEKKYPKIFRFAVNRFSIQRFAGLPLTFLIIAFAVNLFLLSEICESVINSPFIIQNDLFLAEWFYNVRSSALAKGFFVFTQAGSQDVVVIVSVILSALLFLKKEIRFLIALLVSLTGSVVTVFLGKHLYHLQRPNHFSYYQEDSYSFPSGHATIAVAFYGLFFYLLIRKTKGGKRRSFYFLCAILFIGMLGFSRIYLCVHYVSDVIGGYFLGSLWLMVSISIIEWKERHRIQEKKTGQLK